MMTESAAQVRVIEERPAYWRVVFDYPPFNIVDATIFEGLQDLLARMDASPSLCPWCEQRVRPRLRHALRVAREHATGPTRSRGGIASRRRRRGTPPTSGRPWPRARDRSRRERLRRRHRGTIWIRQPGSSGRGAGRVRRRARAPDRLLRSACHRGGEESPQPSLVAIRRPAPRRPELFYDRANVA